MHYYLFKIFNRAPSNEYLDLQLRFEMVWDIHEALTEQAVRFLGLTPGCLFRLMPQPRFLQF